ncbi:MFS transporter [Sphaerisporangium perillae]|uniref:MFS transporter n=1 Tax=Sphaerisporangium perillae TaxID=2935860 RepID=UPI00200F00E3|nr:MFS transporter [Sphaerisporangium perillae]
MPIGILCLVWGAITLRRVAPAHSGRGVDLPGNVLVLVSLGGLLLALSEVTRLGWAHPLVFAGLAGFTLGLPAFVVLQLRSPHPVVDVRLFRDRLFALGTLASFLNSVARVGVVFLIALFFQGVHGEDPVTAGLKVLPLSMAAMLSSAASGFLQRRFSPRALTVLGSGLTTAGLAVLLAVISAEVPYLPVGAALVLMGAGSGMFLPSNTTVLLHGLPSGRLGIVNAMRLMPQNTGVVVGTALAASPPPGPPD